MHSHWRNITFSGQVIFNGKVKRANCIEDHYSLAQGYDDGRKKFGEDGTAGSTVTKREGEVAEVVDWLV